MKISALLTTLLNFLRAIIDDRMNAVFGRHSLVGDIYFNVARDEAHGMLEVRRNAASGGHSFISFRVGRPYQVDPRRISGRAIQAIMTHAMLEGYDPVRLTIMGKEVNTYRKVVRIVQQDIREHEFGQTYFPQRIVSPADAGLCLTQIPEAA